MAPRTRRTQHLSTALAVAVGLCWWGGATAHAAEPAPDGGPIIILTEHAQSAPTTVVDARGNTTVVWAKDAWRGPVRAVRRPAGGDWGRPVTIGTGTDPVAAADARGNVTVVFVTHPRRKTAGISAVRRLVGQGWQAPRHLSKDKRVRGYAEMPGDVGPFGAHRVDLAVNARGDTVVVWQWGSYDEDRPFRIQSVYRRAGNPWNPMARLTTPDWSENPRVAIGPGGDATVVYTEALSDPPTTYSRRRVAGKGWGGRVAVRRGATDGDVAMDASGAATFLSTYRRHGTQSLRSSRRPPGAAGWSSPRRVSARGRDVWDWSLVGHPSGALSVAMQRPSGRIDVARRPVGGPWRAPVAISPRAPGASPPVVATTTNDVLAVLWANGSLGLRGRVRYADGAWTPAFQVSGAPGNFGSYGASTYPNGDLLATWTLGHHVVKVRRMSR